MTRSTDLLKAAALAFNDGRDPFSTEFLVEHNVTSEECMWLSTMIATQLMGVLVASNDLRQTVLALGVVGLTNEASEERVRIDPAIMEHTMAGQQAIRKIREL